MYAQGSLDTGFRAERERQVKQLYRDLLRHHAVPRLYYKIHPVLENIEYLVGPGLDLAAGEPLSGTPTQRAAQFLLAKHQLFGLSDQGFRSRLFSKHTLRSQMGTHCIFELRAGTELAENSFVVHLDSENRVVMVASVYHPQPRIQIEGGSASLEGELPEALTERLQAMEEKLPRSATMRVQPMLVPNWDAGTYERLWQVKITTPKNDVVCLYRDDGNAARAYSVYSGAGPGRMVLGRIYRDFWSPKLSPDLHAESEDARTVLMRELQTVALRDLESNLELIGRYVAVRDEVYTYYWTSLSSDELFIQKEGLMDSSWIDRMMAYYHLDLIQRYVRDLGLGVLDAYSQLNPLHVVLDPELGRTGYQPNGGQIRIRAIKKGRKITDARDARILYHEFVHAVTDALARLGRQDVNEEDNKRHGQILQATAMNEGLADYFACSLAARYGEKRPYIHPRMNLVVKGGKILVEWPSRPRRLGTADGQARGYTLKNLPSDGMGSLEYVWGEQWGRYLWQLRCTLGAEIADILIAHSIFFLTRWSTFGMGVLAIMLADRLLFGGVHASDILSAGDGARDWEICDLETCLEADRPPEIKLESRDDPALQGKEVVWKN